MASPKLAKYRSRRDFTRTAEPSGEVGYDGAARPLKDAIRMLGAGRA